jgi:hypothetical protein
MSSQYKTPSLGDCGWRSGPLRDRRKESSTQNHEEPQCAPDLYGPPRVRMGDGRVVLRVIQLGPTEENKNLS